MKQATVTPRKEPRWQQARIIGKCAKNLLVGSGMTQHVGNEPIRIPAILRVNSFPADRTRKGFASGSMKSAFLPTKSEVRNSQVSRRIPSHHFHMEPDLRSSWKPIQRDGVPPNVERFHVLIGGRAINRTLPHHSTLWPVSVDLIRLRYFVEACTKLSGSC